MGIRLCDKHEHICDVFQINTIWCNIKNIHICLLLIISSTEEEILRATWFSFFSLLFLLILFLIVVLSCRPSMSILLFLFQSRPYFYVSLSSSFSRSTFHVLFLRLCPLLLYVFLLVTPVRILTSKILFTRVKFVQFEFSYYFYERVVQIRDTVRCFRDSCTNTKLYEVQEEIYASLSNEVQDVSICIFFSFRNHRVSIIHIYHILLRSSHWK